MDDAIYVLQNKTYVYQVGHNNLIYVSGGSFRLIIDLIIW
jgi:hypothetical protein